MKCLLLLFLTLLCTSTYAQKSLLIDKQHLKLYVIEKRGNLCDSIFSTPIGCGKNLGKSKRKVTTKLLKVYLQYPKSKIVANGLMIIRMVRENVKVRMALTFSD